MVASRLFHGVECGEVAVAQDHKLLRRIFSRTPHFLSERLRTLEVKPQAPGAPLDPASSWSPGGALRSWRALPTDRGALRDGSVGHTVAAGGIFVDLLVMVHLGFSQGVGSTCEALLVFMHYF